MNTRSIHTILAARTLIPGLILALGLVGSTQPAGAIAVDPCDSAATIAFPMLTGSGYEHQDNTGVPADYPVLAGSGYEGHGPMPECASDAPNATARTGAPEATTPSDTETPAGGGLYAAILAGSGYQAPASGTIATAVRYPVLEGSGYDVVVGT